MDDVFSQNLFGVEFDPLYTEIEATLAQQDESADPLSLPDEPPKINWRLIAEQSGKLLEQCYDLRVALWLIRANMHRVGISALFRGLVELEQQVSENRIKLYPISEDEPINSGHAAALGWLSTAQCIAELKSAMLTTEHTYTVSELIYVDSGTNLTDQSQTIPLAQLLTVNTYFQQNGLPDLLEQFTVINNVIKKFEDYANQYSEGYQLNCEQLHIFLKKCIDLISKSSSNIHSEDLSLNTDTAYSSVSSKRIIGSHDVSIHSRQEVILMLDRILEYYQHHEPSHPAPIFIRRTKQMIGMDFISIVEDLLPDSLGALQQFTGK
ncbi:ImpA family type VI secretion system protein [Serratia sp. UGAL515B_01]|uniref:type VI secretion system protein TssA n=1 Tax=Serratia sp. UGAL515B_01 TaxID=2986763 RepID=UPI002953E358|nr:type VI secretion system ImpA family N-terminal domain-containing protein [Serratia sp. UGAL515B_01]WON77452.1 type VI secretion system ImpA family N-terminal domain-containing protein [Serratia sp. UGAL515B_01]